MNRLSKIVDLLAYQVYTVAARMRQLPTVWRERNPQILSDDVITAAQGDRFAIVVKYTRFRVTEDFLDLLAALRAKSINAIVICNGVLAPADRTHLETAAHRIIVRPNIGRDIGAYRAATLHLNRTGLVAARVLYLNDSVFYLRGPGLDAMLDGLVADDYEVTGTFENHEYSHHVGSFAFSIAGQVFADPRMLRFWQDYPPYDLRPHAIDQGEIGYSRCLKRAGYRIDVIFAVDKLARRLDQMSLTRLVELLRYLPVGPFREYALDAAMSGPTKVAALLGEKERPLTVSLTPAATRVPTLSTYRAQSQRAAPEKETNTESALLIGKVQRHVLVSHMMYAVVGVSQIHYGCGLFLHVMNCPLVKKDLIMRGILLEHECARLLDHVADAQRAKVMRELINRGRASHRGVFHRFQLRHGLI